MSVAVHHGDSREVLKTLADASIDACVCDPPYALVSIGKRFGADNAAPAKPGKTGAYQRASAGFMGAKWDTGETAFDAEFWREVYRVLKPGAHVVAFSGTRTYHRLACAIEDAGFEIRDMVAWLYGSGFPKSHDVAKGIDRAGGISPQAQSAMLRGKREAAGLTREAVAAAVGCTASSVRDWEEGRARSAGGALEFIVPSNDYRIRLADLLGYSADERRVVGVATVRRGDGTVVGLGHSGDLRAGGNTESSRDWMGWGTALKPALEPVVLARKPLDGTVAANVLKHGPGALNVDKCRIDADWDNDPSSRGFGHGFNRDGYSVAGSVGNAPQATTAWEPIKGRWPANVVHDGSDDVLDAFPHTSSGLFTGARSSDKFRNTYGTFKGTPEGETETYGDSGSAARFFYCAETDDLCGLCDCPSGSLSTKLSACNANTAEQSSPTESTPNAASAPCGAVASQRQGRGGRRQQSSDPATVAESSSPRRRLTDSDTADELAWTPPPSSLVQSVRSAGNLCGSCATAIAQSLAATQLGHDPASLPCPASMPERNWRILSSNLALHVAGRERTDITTTTESLKTLLGSVLHAIGATTNSERAASAANIDPDQRRFHYSSKADAEDRLGSKHPTVKPIDLMAWLCRLVTPPGGLVLDPFAGTGTTGLAAMREGFSAILIEREEQYIADINRRLAWARGEGRLTAQETARAEPKTVDDLPLFGGEAA